VCPPLFLLLHLLLLLLLLLLLSPKLQIRSDLGATAFKSVADSNNYGDDVTAAYLL
jgi:hypothetical protein